MDKSSTNNIESNDNGKKERFYWLKLKRDFFKRHDIQIIEDIQPNGKEYVLFYLKLMVESIDHDGELRFSDTIPYNAQMLATITRTNIDIVRGALKVLNEFNMIEILSDQSIYIAAVKKMIGSAVNNDNANRQRRFRENQKQLALQERYDCVTKNNESKSKSKSIEIDKKKEKEKYIKEKERKLEACESKCNSWREEVKEIIDYLNERLGTKYGYETAETKKLIHGRLSEGRTVDDFKKVIDTKINDWLGTEQAKFLRPNTLFRPANFDNYINQQFINQTGRENQTVHKNKSNPMEALRQKMKSGQVTGEY